MEVARSNISRAGLTDKWSSSRASEGTAKSLARLHRDGRGPFDLIFIDADKPGYPDYLAWSLKSSRPGTVIVGDNVVRGGQVADARCADATVVAPGRSLN